MTYYISTLYIEPASAGKLFAKSLERIEGILSDEPGAGFSVPSPPASPPWPPAAKGKVTIFWSSVNRSCDTSFSFDLGVIDSDVFSPLLTASYSGTTFSLEDSTALALFDLFAQLVGP